MGFREFSGGVEEAGNDAAGPNTILARSAPRHQRSVFSARKHECPAGTASAR